MNNTQQADKNEYALLNFKRDYSSPEDKERTQKFQPVVFYKLNDDGSYENGTTLEEMLRVCLERLTYLNSCFSCEDNNVAIEAIKIAQTRLNDRTKDRVARGVEGKHLK